MQYGYLYFVIFVMVDKANQEPYYLREKQDFQHLYQHQETLLKLIITSAKDQLINEISAVSNDEYPLEADGCLTVLSRHEQRLSQAILYVYVVSQSSL